MLFAVFHVLALFRQVVTVTTCTSELFDENMIDAALVGNSARAPAPPFRVVEELPDGTALIGVGTPETMSGVGAAGIENRDAAAPLVGHGGPSAKVAVPTPVSQADNVTSWVPRAGQAPPPLSL